jgi:hypothetical protein
VTNTEQDLLRTRYNGKTLTAELIDTRVKSAVPATRLGPNTVTDGAGDLEKAIALMWRVAANMAARRVD